MILVGLCIKEADRLGVPVSEFVGRSGPTVFAVGRAYQEYESLMYGYDNPRTGLYEQLVSDLAKVSVVLDGFSGTDVREALSQAGLVGDELDRVARWLASMTVSPDDGLGLGSAVRTALRRWESTIAHRRSALQEIVPRWDPDTDDIPEIDRIEGEIAIKWPSNGSWRVDRLIFAQTHGRACKEPVAFVSEDRRHFGHRRETLLRMTRIHEIEGLDGGPLPPR